MKRFLKARLRRRIQRELDNNTYTAEQGEACEAVLDAGVLAGEVLRKVNEPVDGERAVPWLLLLQIVMEVVLAWLNRSPADIDGETA